MFSDSWAIVEKSSTMCRDAAIGYGIISSRACARELLVLLPPLAPPTAFVWNTEDRSLEPLGSLKVDKRDWCDDVEDDDWPDGEPATL